MACADGLIIPSNAVRVAAAAEAAGAVGELAALAAVEEAATARTGVAGSLDFIADGGAWVLAVDFGAAAAGATTA